MPKQQQPPKRKRGGQPKDPAVQRRNNLTFRTRDDLRAALEAAAAKTHRSVSEEIEQRLRHSLASEDDIERLRDETRKAQSAAYVQALRLAGFAILRDIEARPTRVTIDVGMLHAEADGLLRSGFTAQQDQPSRQESRPRTAEEDERLLQEVEQLRATVAALMKKRGDEAA
jgi:hypothetical protein